MASKTESIITFVWFFVAATSQRATALHRLLLSADFLNYKVAKAYLDLKF